MSVLDEPKIDCHCHVLDPARFPYHPGTPFHPTGQEVAPAHLLARVHAANGVGQALLVQPNSGYADDNSCLLAAIAESGGCWRGVAVVGRDTGLEELAALKAQGIVGVAFNLPFFERGHYAGYAPLIARLAELDMILQLQVQGEMIFDILPLVERSPVRLVFDHCGRPDPAAGLDQPGFQALLALGRAGRAAVKLSGHYKISGESHPFADLRPYVAALLEAFGPGACVWASDWPFLRAKERVDYGPLLLLAEELMPDPVIRRQVFHDTPRRLFGFAD